MTDSVGWAPELVELAIPRLSQGSSLRLLEPRRRAGWAMVHVVTPRPKWLG